MTEYAGIIRDTAAAPAISVSVTVKSVFLCILIGLLCWVVATPFFVLSAMAIKAFMAWSGLQAG